MPSVFTIDGVDVTAPKPAKPAKPKRARKSATPATLGDTPVVGFCKAVNNPKTGCEMQLCYVGLGARTRTGKKSRTGWEFQQGSSRCSRR
jgi:hypothetical protein